MIDPGTGTSSAGPGGAGVGEWLARARPSGRAAGREASEVSELEMGSAVSELDAGGAPRAAGVKVVDGPDEVDGRDDGSVLDIVNENPFYEQGGRCRCRLPAHAPGETGATVAAAARAVGREQISGRGRPGRDASRADLGARGLQTANPCREGESAQIAERPRLGVWTASAVGDVLWRGRLSGGNAKKKRNLDRVLDTCGEMR